MTQPKAWGITDGSAGMVAQVRALADALGVDITHYAIALRRRYRWVPNALFPLVGRLVLSHMVRGAQYDLQTPPDMVISCGRKGALVAAALKQRFPAVKVLHIQDPLMSARYFDLVVAMQHDRITAPNVLKAKFALHRISPAVLAQAEAQFAPRFAAYDRPRAAVLLGGSTNKYTLTPEAFSEVLNVLDAVRVSHSLLITPSRRTGAENLARLEVHFRGDSGVYCYDFISDNPYLGLLACADLLVVTNDSVNMMSEAYATGKPLIIIPLAKHVDTKPARFAQMLVDSGTACYAGQGAPKPHTPEREMETLVQEIRARLGL
jgi:uncharacterized protein